MKPSNQNNSVSQWTGGWIACLLFWVVSSNWVGAAETATNGQFTAAEPGEYANSLTLGVGHFFVDGDTAAFQRRWQRPGDETFGGVEELHYEQMVGERGLFTLDGRGLFNYRDYSVQLGLSDPQIGYVRGGYDQFRTFYDGSGGYSPLSNAWVSIYNEELFVDRGRAWIEAGLTLPEWPVFSVRYSYDFRDGQKDSTSWGDYSLSANTANLRSIVPTYLDLDERRHSVEADMIHTLDSVTYGLGIRYGHDDLDNSRNITRRPNDPTRVRTVTQTDDTSTDMLNGHGFVQTRVSPQVQFTLGGSYTHLDADIGGSRVYFYGATPPQNNDEGFMNLGGGSEIDQYVANFNVMYTPCKDFTIVPSVRVEHQDQSGIALFEETNVSGGSPVPPEDILNTRLRDFTDVTTALAVRYTGITNWSLYTRGEWLVGQGTLEEDEFDVADPDSPLVQLARVTDSDRFVQKYVAGANWYPCAKANTAIQYYYRDRRNDYDHLVDTTATGNNLYPAFIEWQRFQTHDVNARLTLRPVANLTLVSRYDFQVTQYEMRGAGLPSGESAESTAHILSQSVSWIPIARLYLQGSISYALQDTESPAADLTGAAAGLVQDAENDYWNASVSAGLALTPRSDLELQYLFFQADNYDPSNAAVGLPYGASARQHAVTATLVNRLRKNIIWKLQYGYFTGDDDTSGRNNDFDAHLVYSSWQFLF